MCSKSCPLHLVIQAVLNNLKGEKFAPNWPLPLVLATKITPKWPKMAQNGCKRTPLVPCVHILTHCTWFVVIQEVLNSLIGETTITQWSISNSHQDSYVENTRTNQFRILSDSLQLVSFDFELLALKICSFEKELNKVA